MITYSLSNVHCSHWTNIPAGTATLGSVDGDPQALASELPRHTVEVAAFYLARWPVTNAEYRAFVDAGGYEEARWWTPNGWLWRQGRLPGSDPAEEILELRDYFLKHPGELARRVAGGRMRPETAAAWQARCDQPEAAVREAALRETPDGPRTQPALWERPGLNHPQQPVVGVAWYEAAAYCAWLQDELEQREDDPDIRNRLAAGWCVRLPSEAEWEWAAGGPAHTRFAWGATFDASRTNTLEGGAQAPTPVGAYPAGVSAHGAVDMSGNVWEWTSTLFRPYPYRADDGREDPLSQDKRVLRGGSWFNNQRGARVSDRKYDRPVYRPNNFGLRVVVGPQTQKKV